MLEILTEYNKLDIDIIADWMLDHGKESESIWFRKLIGDKIVYPEHIFKPNIIDQWNWKIVKLNNCKYIKRLIYNNYISVYSFNKLTFNEGFCGKWIEQNYYLNLEIIGKLTVIYFNSYNNAIKFFINESLPIIVINSFN